MAVSTDNERSAGRAVAVELERPLQILTPRQIQQIDETLARLGPFAEVRLIKNRGKLRFIQRVDSESLAGPD